MEVIDVWAQLPSERFLKEPWLETLLRWTGQKAGIAPLSPEDLLRQMDEAGVAISLISAWHGPSGALITNDEVERAVDAAPERFRGLMSVDLFDPMGAVREIRTRSKSGKFAGLRIVPWLWDLPPNDRRYYPVYAACVDAGLPFCTQLGHTGPLKRSETGRPIPYLEEVLLDFPELLVIGGHVGFPWIDEVISLAHKFPNFYVDTSAYAVHRLPEGLVRFMKAEGRSRVMFGTNAPMLSASRCLAKLDALGLDDAVKEQFLSGNARRVFSL
ncbi:MAG: amidohydrolase [Parvularcula sp.]|nr:amidohydrolase [Parvularcula sp.]